MRRYSIIKRFREAGEILRDRLKIKLKYRFVKFANHWNMFLFKVFNLKTYLMVLI